MQQTDKIAMSKVREAVTRIVRQEPIPDDAVQDARDTFKNMCETAVQYGLPAADVIKAVFRPVFAPERVCDCWSCKTRRHADTEDRISDRSLPIS